MIGEMGRPFAVIADIHGNVDALRAVLADIQGAGVCDIVNLGDILSGPLAARETAELLMPLDVLHIRGNHDRYLLELDPKEMGLSDRVAYDQLTRVHLDWLRAMPGTRLVGDDIFLCHGTPNDDNTYWLEEVTPQSDLRLRPRAGIEFMAKGVRAGLILCAHSHIARRAEISDGQVIVNPGSVGCPAYDDSAPHPHIVESGSASASYAILERVAAGWKSLQVEVPYDPSRMVTMAKAAGRLDWANAVQTGWFA